MTDLETKDLQLPPGWCGQEILFNDKRVALLDEGIDPAPLCDAALAKADAINAKLSIAIISHDSFSGSSRRSYRP